MLPSPPTGLLPFELDPNAVLRSDVAKCDARRARASDTVRLLADPEASPAEPEPPRVSQY
jgi:hypothetical protein